MWVPCWNARSDVCGEANMDARSEARGDACVDVRSDARSDTRGNPNMDARSDPCWDVRSDACGHVNMDARSDACGHANTDARSKVVFASSGPGGKAGFLPVAIQISSIKRNHSRYNRLEKMMNTNSWKSSGPFVGPKVRPRGIQVPEIETTAIFSPLPSSFSH